MQLIDLKTKYQSAFGVRLHVMMMIRVIMESWPKIIAEGVGGAKQRNETREGKKRACDGSDETIRVKCKHMLKSYKNAKKKSRYFKVGLILFVILGVFCA